MRSLKIRADQEQKVDDASTKETLHLMYHQLTRLMDGQGKRDGIAFEGTADELFTLRDRVVFRLAVFDMYGKALKEAQTADVDY